MPERRGHIRWAGHFLTEKLLDEGLIARRWTVLQLQKGSFSRARPNNPGREISHAAFAGPGRGREFRQCPRGKGLSSTGPTGAVQVHFSVVLGSSAYVLDAAWPDCKVGVEIVAPAGRVHVLRTSWSPGCDCALNSPNSGLPAYPSKLPAARLRCRPQPGPAPRRQPGRPAA